MPFFTDHAPTIAACHTPALCCQSSMRAPIAGASVGSAVGDGDAATGDEGLRSALAAAGARWSAPTPRPAASSSSLESAVPARSRAAALAMRAAMASNHEPLGVWSTTPQSASNAARSLGGVSFRAAAALGAARRRALTQPDTWSAVSSPRSALALRGRARQSGEASVARPRARMRVHVPLRLTSEGRLSRSRISLMASSSVSREKPPNSRSRCASASFAAAFAAASFAAFSASSFAAWAISSAWRRPSSIRSDLPRCARSWASSNLRRVSALRASERAERAVASSRSAASTSAEAAATSAAAAASASASSAVVGRAAASSRSSSSTRARSRRSGGVAAVMPLWTAVAISARKLATSYQYLLSALRSLASACLSASCPWRSRSAPSRRSLTRWSAACGPSCAQSAEKCDMRRSWSSAFVPDLVSPTP